jgi:hypothetical protein
MSSGVNKTIQAYIGRAMRETGTALKNAGNVEVRQSEPPCDVDIVNEN